MEVYIETNKIGWYSWCVECRKIVDKEWLISPSFRFGWCRGCYSKKRQIGIELEKIYGKKHHQL